MKVSVEGFLLDNALMNYCVYALTASWLGVRLRLLPTALISLIGAIYALLSLFIEPALREWYWKLPCFLLLSLLLFRDAGGLRMLPFLLLSAATVGGAALMLTLLLGGSVTSDGTILGTVPLRAALVSAFAASVLPRLMRAMLTKRVKKDLHTTVVVRLKTHTYRVRALIDSGNLLKEPVTGLPVLLLDVAPDAPTHPIPYATSAQDGLLLGERARLITLPDYGGAAVDCFCARSPQPIVGAQAVLPESVLPHRWRTDYAHMDQNALGTPAHQAARWQTQYLLVHSHKRKPSAAARSGGGGTVHRARRDRQSREG